MRLAIVDWLSIVSLLLAIIALVFAVVQMAGARRQVQSLERQGQALTFVTDSLSTRYLGPFPDYLGGLVDLIDSAKRELIMLWGNPGPGFFTDPTNSMNYR